MLEQEGTPSLPIPRRNILKYAAGTLLAAVATLRGGVLLYEQTSNMHTYVEKGEPITLPMSNGFSATSRLNISYAEDVKEGGMRWSTMEIKICIEGPQEIRDEMGTHRTILDVGFLVTSRLSALDPSIGIQSELIDKEGRKRFVSDGISESDRNTLIQSIYYLCANEARMIQDSQESNETVSPFLLKFSELQEGDSTPDFTKRHQPEIMRLGLARVAQQLSEHRPPQHIASNQ